MICLSRARNKSFEPIASRFFGRLFPSDEATESRHATRGNPKSEIARFHDLKPQNLAIQNQLLNGKPNP
jgi:hypothetical protein